MAAAAATALGVIVDHTTDRAAGRCAGSPAAPTPQAAAPFDPTGYWVSVVTEDWRWRMVTPTRGDVDGVPLNPAGLKMALSWDFAKDVATPGAQCKAYGGAAIMRMPTRLHTTWAPDGRSLKVETDAGTQVRTFNFDAARQQLPRRVALQGTSIASWIDMAGGRGRGGRGGGGGAAAAAAADDEAAAPQGAAAQLAQAERRSEERPQRLRLDRDGLVEQVRLPRRPMAVPRRLQQTPEAAAAAAAGGGGRARVRQRHAEGRDDESSRGLSAEERRAV